MKTLRVAIASDWSKAMHASRQIGLLATLVSIAPLWMFGCQCATQHPYVRLDTRMSHQEPDAILWRVVNGSRETIWIPEKITTQGHPYSLPFLFVGPREELFYIYGYFSFQGREAYDVHPGVITRAISPGCSAEGRIQITSRPAVPISELQNPWTREDGTIHTEEVSRIDKVIVVIQYRWHDPQVRLGRGPAKAKRIQFAEHMIDAIRSQNEYSEILVSDPIPVDIHLEAPVTLHVPGQFAPENEFDHFIDEMNQKVP